MISVPTFLLGYLPLLLHFLCTWRLIRSSVFLRVGLLSLITCLLGWTLLQLGGDDPLILTSSSGLLFSARLYPMGFFKHISEDAKVCSPEVEGCDGASFPSSFLSGS